MARWFSFWICTALAIVASLAAVEDDFKPDGTESLQSSSIVDKTDVSDNDFLLGVDPFNVKDYSKYGHHKPDPQSREWYKHNPPNRNDWEPFGSDRHWQPFGNDRHWVPFGKDHDWVPYGSDSDWEPFGDDKNWVPFGEDSDWRPHEGDGKGCDNKQEQSNLKSYRMHRRRVREAPIPQGDILEDEVQVIANQKSHQEEPNKNLEKFEMSSRLNLHQVEPNENLDAFQVSSVLNIHEKELNVNQDNAQEFLKGSSFDEDAHGNLRHKETNSMLVSNRKIVVNPDSKQNPPNLATNLADGSVLERLTSFAADSGLPKHRLNPLTTDGTSDQIQQTSSVRRIKEIKRRQKRESAMPIEVKNSDSSSQNDISEPSLPERRIPFASDTETLAERWVQFTSDTETLAGRWVPFTSGNEILAERWVPFSSDTERLAERRVPFTSDTETLAERWVPFTSDTETLAERWVPFSSDTESLAERWVPFSSDTESLAGRWVPFTSDTEAMIERWIRWVPYERVKSKTSNPLVRRRVRVREGLITK